MPAWDEAYDDGGRPRGRYRELLRAVEEARPVRLSARLRAWVAKLGVTFGSDEPWPADPIPRLIDSEEWAALGAGLAQRTRALNAFIADVYGERRIVSAGVIPADAIASADHYEPAMNGVRLALPHAPVVGFDVVRGEDGRMRVLEDNLRTPSGAAYAVDLRRAMRTALPELAALAPAGLDATFEPLREVLHAATVHHGDGVAVVLTDGPSNGAYYEHRAIARRLGIPLVTPERLRRNGDALCVAAPNGRLTKIAVLYRRTDEDRVRAPDGTATWLGEMILEPLRRGVLSVVNAPGSGVADDKLIHAYVEEMVRFYLGEDPLVESVKTYDVSRPATLARTLERLPQLVVKPRNGFGGNGVFIGPAAPPAERESVADALRADPGRFVAQETVQLSRHPTVRGDELEQRHVDLRVFAVAAPDGVRVLPAALTRVARDGESLIVNSSQGGGAKDTWVLAGHADGSCEDS